MKKNSMIKREHIFLLMFLSLLVFSESLFAQQRQISGKVTAADGQPIPGAVVKVKGKTGGTGTTNEGAYTINAQTGDILQVSSIGFVAKEVTVGQSNSINISLDEENQGLNEGVVVG